MTLKTGASAFLSSGLLTFALTMPRPSIANERRMSAAFCRPSPMLDGLTIGVTSNGGSPAAFDGHDQSELWSNSAHNASGSGNGAADQVNTSTSYLSTMACPFVSDSTLEHGTLTHVHVHGIDGSSDSTWGVWGAQLCVDFYDFDGTSSYGGNGLAGTCSSLRYSNSNSGGGTSQSASATFVGTVYIDLDSTNYPTWANNGTHWPYIFVFLPTPGTSTNVNGGTSMISGYYASQ